MKETIEQFKSRVERAVKRPRNVLDRADLTEAAVLVPIVFRKGEPHLIVTRRTMNVATHKGQISFPGGVREPIDAGPIDTALRESEEEIGLDPEAVTVIGLLDDFVTSSGFAVTPVVGLVDSGTRCAADPVEVAEIIEAPFARLSDPACHEIRTVDQGGLSYSSHFYRVGNHTIWGATAGIIYRFLKALAEAA